MRVETKLVEQKVFEKKVLTITIESERELDMLKCIFIGEKDDSLEDKVLQFNKEFNKDLDIDELYNLESELSNAI